MVSDESDGEEKEVVVCGACAAEGSKEMLEVVVG
jgi:hypothetical protein